MENLQTQLNTLNGKVDALYQLVEQMSHQLSALLAGQQTDVGALKQVEGRTSSSLLSTSSIPQISTVSRVSSADELSIGHKDVLEDEQNLDRLLDYNTDERSLSPDLQIRRLTAQVTAAYNRIAALEEQLLARRSDREDKKLTRSLAEETQK
ncbi:MAG: hypothetical protein J7647_16390 [Cyanobacteria bacterium SBLK]|nr:hypothetical protein [Cyanobacteria bacterium SBLK]